MWLVYPITKPDIRSARCGILLLLTASAVWYLGMAGVLAVWQHDIMLKVNNKFTELDPTQTNWKPFLVLLGVFCLAGLLRLIGYRLCRNVAGAVGAADGLFVALIGGVIWGMAAGTLIFGFSGMLAFVMACGTALELKFLRFAGQVYGMVVSPQALRRLTWYFHARTAWLMAVIVAALLLLIAQILTDIPKNPNGPIERTVNNVNHTLETLFDAVSVIVILTLPAMTLAYWAMLFVLYGSLDKLLDPKGPAVQPDGGPRPGHDLLKEVLQPYNW